MAGICFIAVLKANHLRKQMNERDSASLQSSNIKTKRPQSGHLVFRR